MTKELQTILADLEQSAFYGTVEIGYQAGSPGHIKVSRTLRLDTNKTSSQSRESRLQSGNSSQR
jgi:hypothetical protein